MITPKCKILKTQLTSSSNKQVQKIEFRNSSPSTESPGFIQPKRRNIPAILLHTTVPGPHPCDNTAGIAGIINITTVMLSTLTPLLRRYSEIIEIRIAAQLSSCDTTANLKIERRMKNFVSIEKLSRGVNTKIFC